MAKSAAMVQLKVVKAGGAGRKLDMTCAEILASFDPKINLGRTRTWSAQEGIPSRAHSSRRRRCTNKSELVPRVDGCSGYSTPSRRHVWSVMVRALGRN